MSVTIEKDGRRYYLRGSTYAIKDAIKNAGGHWDADRRAWWTGDRETAEKLTQTAPAPSTEVATDVTRLPIKAKARYKDRSYYVIGESKNGSRLHLSVLDGSIHFWVDAASTKVEKTYSPLEKFCGYGVGTREIYPTLQSIKRFVEKQKQDSTRRGQCSECGSWGPSGETCAECREGIHG